jgi:hypothetical protein
VETDMTEDVSMGRNKTSTVPQPGQAGRRGSLVRQTLQVLAWGPKEVTSRAARWAVSDLAIAGAVLILASAIIHLRLWADGGYQGISVIGPLFLAQGIVGILFAVVLGLFRRLGLIVAGAILMLATAGGLLISVYVGLFGYTESLAVPYAGLSLVVEFAGAGILAIATILFLVARQRRPGNERVWPPTA